MRRIQAFDGDDLEIAEHSRLYRSQQSERLLDGFFQSGSTGNPSCYRNVAIFRVDVSRHGSRQRCAVTSLTLNTVHRAPVFMLLSLDIYRCPQLNTVCLSEVWGLASTVEPTTGDLFNLPD